MQRLKNWPKKFDGVTPESIRVRSEEIEEACARFNTRDEASAWASFVISLSSTKLKNLNQLRLKLNPVWFVSKWLILIRWVCTSQGQRTPLPSTVLMLVFLLRLLVVVRLCFVSPPPIADEILYVAKLCKIDEVLQCRRWSSSYCDGVQRFYRERC